MADVKISALPAAGALAGTEEVPVVQSGVTKKTTTQDIADLGGGSAGYLVYVAIMTQTGTDAPVPTILQNTIGDIIWARSNAGTYFGTLAVAFPEGKTFLIATCNAFTAMSAGAARASADSINYYTLDDTFSGQDGNVTFLEIRVYP